jgi:hypothetical protein
MAGCHHRGEAGLNAFADHKQVAWIGEAHCAATTRAEHHFLRFDRRFPAAITARKVRWIASGVHAS